MEREVIINIGVSGAGKTTWSIDRIKNNPKTMRINRDDIRKLLIGTLDGYYKKANLNEIETYINDLEQMIFLNHVSSGYSVIIDNTNLTPRYIQKWISLVENYNLTLNKDQGKFEIKIKIFRENNENTLRHRIIFRDQLKLQDTEYINKQIQSLKSGIMYAEDSYKNLIINE